MPYVTIAHHTTTYHSTPPHLIVPHHVPYITPNPYSTLSHRTDPYRTTPCHTVPHHIVPHHVILYQIKMKLKTKNNYYFRYYFRIRTIFLCQNSLSKASSFFPPLSEYSRNFKVFWEGFCSICGKGVHFFIPSWKIRAQGTIP